MGVSPWSSSTKWWPIEVVGISPVRDLRETSLARTFLRVYSAGPELVSVKRLFGGHSMTDERKKEALVRISSRWR